MVQSPKWHTIPTSRPLLISSGNVSIQSTLLVGTRGAVSRHSVLPPPATSTEHAIARFMPPSLPVKTSTVGGRAT